MTSERERAGDPWTARLRGFGPTGILAIVIVLLAGNVSVLGLPVIPAGASVSASHSN